MSPKLAIWVAAVMLAGAVACSVNVDRDIAGPRDSRDQIIRQTDPNDCFYVTMPATFGGTPTPVITPTPKPCR